MLTAQQAATGARICMASAVRTIGRKFRNRRRIDRSTLFERYQLITRTNQCRDWTAGRCPALHPFVQSGTEVIPQYEIRQVLTVGRARFQITFPTRPPPRTNSHATDAIRVCNNDRYANCRKFEQSLLKRVTSGKKWSTSYASGLPRGLSLVVQVSGGALTRTSSVALSIKIKSKFSGK